MNLDGLFHPRSIAVVGASRDQNSVGYGVLKNLVHGCDVKGTVCRPFPGRVYAVNPNAKSILGLDCYKGIVDIEGKVDLAIIVVPARVVLPVVKQCAQKRVKAIIIISAGFGELGENKKGMQDEVVRVLKKARIPLLGPNCLGIIMPHSHMNASFAPETPPKGNIAFLSQSGALADSIIDWAIENRFGFSAIVSYGNKAMLDVHDFLEYFDKDINTKVIAMYIEGINDGRKFINFAKKVKKPMIVLKSGRTEEGVRAISSHTGSLAGSYEVYKAAFKQCNVQVADTVEELFDNAKALAHQPALKGGVAIVTNGGGCGVLCADFCSQLGVPLAGLGEGTLKKLDKCGKMHPAYSRRNPLDIVGDALPERYEAAINILLSESYIGGLIVIQTLQSTTQPIKDSEVIISAKRRFPNKPVICVYMGGKSTKKAIEMMEDAGIPDYNDLRKAALAMKSLIR